MKGLSIVLALATVLSLASAPGMLAQDTSEEAVPALLCVNASSPIRLSPASRAWRKARPPRRPSAPARSATTPLLLIPTAAAPAAAVERESFAWCDVSWYATCYCL